MKANLKRDAAVTATLRTYLQTPAPVIPFVWTIPKQGCWVINGLDQPDIEWTKPAWDSHQAIAEALLAMPLPDDS